MVRLKNCDSGWKTDSKYEITLFIWCEFAPGKRTGFDFDVELTENEMRELAREFLNN